MQGKADGEENARLGEKIQGRQKKLKGKKERREEKRKKIKEKLSKQQWKYNFFLQYDNFAVENRDRGQNNEVHNE